MSTRANVHITSTGLPWPEPTLQLYHHCDGYPSNMLPLIAKAHQLAGGGWEAGRNGKVASFLCAADPGEFEPETDTTLHGDIEYFYVIRCANGAGGSVASKPKWTVDVFTKHGVDDGPRKRFWDTGDPKLLREIAKGLTIEACADEKEAERIEALG